MPGLSPCCSSFLLMHLGRRQVMAQVLGPLPCMWEIWIEFQTSGFVCPCLGWSWRQFSVGGFLGGWPSMATRNEGRKTQKGYCWTGHRFSRKQSWKLGPANCLQKIRTDCYLHQFISCLLVSCVSLWSKLIPKSFCSLCILWPCAKTGISMVLVGSDLSMRDVVTSIMCVCGEV